MPTPMPSPRGTNHAGLFLAEGGPTMAMDAMPKNGLRGARDQDNPDDPDNVVVASSPGQAALLKLGKFLADKLNQDDIDQVMDLIQELLASTDDTSANTSDPAMAGDRRPTHGYLQNYPHAARLGRSGLTGIVPGSGNTSSITADRAASSDYERRFPNANRLGRTVF
jgi:hypothetical protein